MFHPLSNLEDFRVFGKYQGAWKAQAQTVLGTETAFFIPRLGDGIGGLDIPLTE